MHEKTTKLRLLLAAAGTAAFLFCTLALLTQVTPAAAPRDARTLPPPLDRKIDFTRDVFPILQSSCHACHGPQKHTADLRLDVKHLALRGGESGPAVLPGKSAESPLIHLVASKDPDHRMPAKGDPLTNGQISTLRAWIDQGAPWPDDADAKDKDKSDH